MEFNFWGDDLKPPSCQFPSLIQSHCTDPFLFRGGFPSVFPLPNTEQMLAPNVAGDDIFRKLEKEKIRREIISGEIARRRMLEEEVRRELMLERELAFRRNLGDKFLFHEQVAIGLNPRLNVIPPYENQSPGDRIAFPNRRLTMPQFSQPENPEIKPAPKSNKDKLIMLAKPDADLYSAKRKAETQCADDDREHSLLGLKKKPKDDRSCALCQVSVMSEKAWNEHLQGKKHKAKESAQRNQKIDRCATTSFSFKKNDKSLKPPENVITATTSRLDPKSAVQVQPGVTWVGINQKVIGQDVLEIKTEDKVVMEKTKNTKDSEKQNGTETKEVRKPNAVNKRRFKVWCELCQVGSFSEVVMENHRKGKKHMNRLKKSCESDGSAPPTFTVASEATPLTKDAEGSPK